MAQTPEDGGVPHPNMDPVTFEVIRNALVNVTEEMALTVRRAAYSTNIKTRADFSCAIFDNQLRCIAQSYAQPPHLISLATIAPASILEFGPDRLGPGDAIVVNDPHRGASHLNDVSIISPAFAGDKRIDLARKGIDKVDASLLAAWLKHSEVCAAEDSPRQPPRDP